MCNYLQLYWLESYLFNNVSTAFHRDRQLSAFDFFCIIIWKANRAKSTIAYRLIEEDKQQRDDLNAIIADITKRIYNAKDDRERMRVLIVDFGFRLPTASAILTVLYPNSFTVYDVRVCNVLDNFHNVQNWEFEMLWTGYTNYITAVRDSQTQPPNLSLRDKDRYLWAQSFAKNLNSDIILWQHIQNNP